MNTGRTVISAGPGRTVKPALPLLPDGPLESILAHVRERTVTRAQFLADVEAAAARLAQAAHAINLCGDRYWFTVGLFACIRRGVVSLLPHADAPEHLAGLAAGHADVVCLLDAERRTGVPGVVGLRVDEAAAAAVMPEPPAEVASPLIPADQCVARLYTSGSTGRPQAIDKRFGALWHGMAAAARRIWAVTSGPCSVVGTSSFRHMFGFESTVLLPLWSAGRVSACLPFFPADVASALEALPAPRLLVTTPYHLRNLLDAGVAFPPLAGVLSATAPLSSELARRAEAALQAPVLEIYGSTELGMTASREPCRDEAWTTLDGLTLARQPDTGLIVASGPGLIEPQPLNDVIELLSPTRFRFIDRDANLVKIVGKRSSLAFLNHLLLDIPGVKDGAFCLPPSEAGKDAARLAAFVVAPGLQAGDILAGLRPHLDAVFLPRPIVFVDRLPRDANGKLPAAAMRALMAEHLD